MEGGRRLSDVQTVTKMLFVCQCHGRSVHLALHDRDRLGLEFNLNLKIEAL
jgi:hypothetical protein